LAWQHAVQDIANSSTIPVLVGCWVAANQFLQLSFCIHRQLLKLPSCVLCADLALFAQLATAIDYFPMETSNMRQMKQQAATFFKCMLCCAGGYPI
jgi:hypothetical protein